MRAAILSIGDELTTGQTREGNAAWLAGQLAARAVTKSGSQINEVDEPEAFRRAVETVYDKHAARYGNLVERIRASLNGR